MSEDQSCADLAPIKWKWFVRLIWFGGIGFFQYVEIARYLGGQMYRPLFRASRRRAVRAHHVVHRQRDPEYRSTQTGSAPSIDLMRFLRDQAFTQSRS
ncbi:hypothetical protein H8A95_16870 [Bradyrhizobium sp. Pear76]|uniref:hypothetical protein n=1 Tax=Bradyrhizobium oropedii TaxID=1571201 RepID=UPI001E453FBF|nr:hypothetical protein [Bradyrhizobium oropedii]MCC8963943.1 hypothetical protein [Bradyrhizobium oropedii]